MGQRTKGSLGSNLNSNSKHERCDPMPSTMPPTFSLLSKKSSKRRLTRRPLFLVRVESLVCTVEMIGPSFFAGAGRDALPRVRRCTSRCFFLLLLRTRSYAIGAKALSLSCFSICTFFWTCDAGSRGSVFRSASLPAATASSIQIGKPKVSSRRCSLYARVAAPIQDSSV